jgi:hypothetical protein
VLEALGEAGGSFSVFRSKKYITLGDEHLQVARAVGRFGECLNFYEDVLLGTVGEGFCLIFLKVKDLEDV